MNKLALLVALVFSIMACRESDDDRRFDDADTQGTDSSSLTDGDTGFPTDTDTVTSDAESTDTTPQPILPDCSGCTGVGTELDNLRCAIELCDDSVFMAQAYTSPVVAADKLDQTRAAVEHFGNPTNDLAPLMNDSYALMATGIAAGTFHSTQLAAFKSVKDDFANDKNTEAFDVMEWSIELKAPAEAKAFQIHYVFFSAEYDEYVGSEFNDRFYILLEAPSTNGGEKTIINFTECRQSTYGGDFVCEAEMADICTPGESYCYLSINNALSECCWYNGCPNGKATTDITGTGFTCAPNQTADTADRGSSTGWLVTSWPIKGGESFKLTFHLHDTSDAKLDSQVILDKFLFLTGKAQGTKPI